MAGGRWPQSEAAWCEDVTASRVFASSTVLNVVAQRLNAGAAAARCHAQCVETVVPPGGRSLCLRVSSRSDSGLDGRVTAFVQAA